MSGQISLPYTEAGVPSVSANLDLFSKQKFFIKKFIPTALYLTRRIQFHLIMPEINVTSILMTRPSKISIFAPIASVQKLCGYFCPMITWGKPQLPRAIPGGSRHPPTPPSKMTFFVKITSH